ncbi:HvfC family RiPP maturation protein [Thiohalomonas denitrificans]|uniref:HvfC family RiPP maturation protein n=1 Tax=Thiohalomonas denitrificans TaxID=415747 RepID=UPI0026F109A7|nr:putative DNA-binding domain-containing protein [Thiohalomonas denitrificans]
MNAVSLDTSLAGRQRCFAAAIRDPERATPADVSPRRMAIYRELFFNNILGVLEDAFPAVRARLSKDDWEAAAGRFFAGHSSTTPYFHRLPGEFAAWLERPPGLDPPYLAELARYEWSQLHLALSPAPAPPEALIPNGDLLTGAPVLASLFRLAAYRYPVHRMCEGESLQDEEPARLLLWRDDVEQVRTLALSPTSARLLELIASSPQLGGRRLLLRLAGEINHPEPERLVEQGRTLLEQLREKGALVGTQPATQGGA